MTKCASCHWPYPPAYLNRLFIQGGYTEPMCGICALDIVNRHLGIARTEFSGPMAERNRQFAIQWRKRNRKLEPKHD